jgi:hypothetical protein
MYLWVQQGFIVGPCKVDVDAADLNVHALGTVGEVYVLV